MRLLLFFDIFQGRASLVPFQPEIIGLGGLVLGGRRGVDIEDAQGQDELGEFLVAVQAHVEVGELADQQVAQVAGVDPSVVVGVFVRELDEGLADAFDAFVVLGVLDGFVLPGARRLGFLAAGVGGIGGGGGVFAFLGFCFGVQHVQVHELVAGRNKGTGRLAFAHAEHVFVGFAQAGGEAGEVAVGGDDAEAVQRGLVEQVHGVDDEGRVAGVFAVHVVVLLHGLDGVVQNHGLPVAHLGRGPVTVNAFVDDIPHVIAFR